MSREKRQTRQINIELPPDIDPTYANFAVITHTPSEIVVDLACVLPNTPTGKVYARVIMTPTSAKALHRALGENLRKYEAQHGEIAAPTGDEGLAGQLFGRVSPPAGDAG
jgi:hypothetical protein